MSYRDGYDFRKWHAAGLRQRPRRYWTRWFLAGSTAVALTATALNGGTGHPPLFLSVLPGFFMTMSPFARDTWATDRGRSMYDEYEHAALLRATARAFAVFIGLVVLMIGWMAWGPALGLPVPTRPIAWMGWLATLLVVGVSLPATFAEFMVPMPDPEDETL